MTVKDMIVKLKGSSSDEQINYTIETLAKEKMLLHNVIVGLGNNWENSFILLWFKGEVS